jgi:hypothetical protein
MDLNKEDSPVRKPRRINEVTRFFEDDGSEGQWAFTGWRLVDLSTLKVRLKAEFQASNADLYRKSALSLPESAR